MQSSSVYICNPADQLGYIRKAPEEERGRETGAESRVIFIPRKCFDHTGVHRGFIELN